MFIVVGLRKPKSALDAAEACAGIGASLPANPEWPVVAAFLTDPADAWTRDRLRCTGSWTCSRTRPWRLLSLLRSSSSRTAGKCFEKYFFDQEPKLARIWFVCKQNKMSTDHRCVKMLKVLEPIHESLHKLVILQNGFVLGKQSPLLSKDLTIIS